MSAKLSRVIGSSVGSMRESFALIRDICRQVNELLRDNGSVRADVDVDTEATALAALVDGLTLRLLFAPDTVTPDAARSIVRAHLRKEST